MSRSDIFDEYERIAIERGLISAAADDKDSPALKRYKKSPWPRAGSDDISTIEALYGVKPDASVKYENNILEAAHPEPAITGPAYDRLNALIENPNEAQAILLNIIDKPTNGNLTQHRYAQEQLLMELIRIANDMDNRGNDTLRVLADSCIERLKKKPDLKKVAIVFIPIILGAAAILAAVGLWGHMDDPSRGVNHDITNALNKLDELKTNSWYESDVDATVQKDVNDLEMRLKALNTKLAGFGSVMDSINATAVQSSASELKEAAASHGEVVSSSLDSVTKTIDEFVPYLIDDINKFTSRDYQERHSKPSWLSGVTSWLGEAAHGRYGVIPNDFILAADALGTLKTSLSDLRATASNLPQLQREYAQKLQEQQSAFKQEKPKKTSPSPSSVFSPGNNEGTNVDEIIEDEDQADSYSNAAKSLGFGSK